MAGALAVDAIRGFLSAPAAWTAEQYIQSLDSNEPRPQPIEKLGHVLQERP